MLTQLLLENRAMVEAKERGEQELPLPVGTGRPDLLARMGGHNSRGDASSGAARTGGRHGNPISGP